MQPEEQRNQLSQLVRENYDLGGDITLHDVAHYWFEDRGIYQVSPPDNNSFLLRAFGYDATPWLRGQAAVLSSLHQQQYPAPRVQYTRQGEIIAHAGQWTAILVSFIEGQMADFTPETLAAMGKQLAHLHKLPAVTNTMLPLSRLHPTLVTPEHMQQLEQSLASLPQELQNMGSEFLASLQCLQQAHELPQGLLHGDCWPHNAICATAQTLAFIDWDGAGLGPLILDLGYLLMYCHLGKPQLPSLEAEPALIQAVIEGYLRVRTLTAHEQTYLLKAIRYNLARRAASENLFAALTASTPWQEQLWLQKMRSQFEASATIASMARDAIRHLSLSQNT
ncbi:hypothetical protein KSD_89590 [Ktedonobacter sp. SOSP1-85]|uniref:phosphotransferase enzyme family protein n=1 Tax=Ktedonobacter sp. SOSP1-85 TaxID=2778367 RepID=UPI00191547B9|nr:phosphotransferase [Ktedonobacter sp. SOSP1-85]GHO81188.1 hypothetical protein KSD_89590 [Ktedonobacter sp. SOSP1-85]